MSGNHARPAQPASESLWRPLALLAVVGLGPPLAIISSPLDAHAIPSGIERRDTAPDANTGNHGATTLPRYISHTDRSGPRRQL